MQSRAKWTIALIILLLVSLGAVGVALAQHDSSALAADKTATSTSLPLPAGLQKRPPSKAFTQYLQDKAAGKVVTRTPDGRGLGYVPPPIQHSRQTTVPTLAQAQAYPATYDLRTANGVNKVSPVQNQGACGSCWTFATFGSLESYLRPGYTTSLSENHLKNLHDFDWGCCSGGNALLSTAYLARWGCIIKDYSGNTIYSGPVTAACDPYALSCTDTHATCPIVKHVQNVYYLPLQTGTNTSTIKHALMTYGAVYAAFQWMGPTGTKSAWWNPAHAAYYDSTRAGGNHAVTIIGWDDTFPKTNFSGAPPKNGAWLVKNSWGTGWGNAGYFYVSYYDLNMGHVENAVFTAAATTNYTKNYMYDPFGQETSWGWLTDEIGYGANVFTASPAGTLKAIGFWTETPGTQYTAQVYVGPFSDATNPKSGTLKSTKSGTVTYAGYYTKSLTTTVPLTNGQKFSVVIKFTTPGDGYPIPAQDYISYFNYEVPETPSGVTFISHDGTTWFDLSDYATYGAVNIHAFVK